MSNADISNSAIFLILACIFIGLCIYELTSTGRDNKTVVAMFIFGLIFFILGGILR